MLVSSLFKKKKKRKEKNNLFRSNEASECIVHISSRKDFLTDRKREFWIMAEMSGFFFLKLKQANTCQQTLTIIRAKISLKQKKIKRRLLIGLQCFLSQSSASDTSILDQCFLEITYLVRITVLSQLPLQTHLFSVTKWRHKMNT